MLLLLYCYGDFVLVYSVLLLLLLVAVVVVYVGGGYLVGGDNSSFVDHQLLVVIVMRMVLVVVEVGVFFFYCSTLQIFHFNCLIGRFFPSWFTFLFGTIHSNYRKYHTNSENRKKQR